MTAERFVKITIYERDEQGERIPRETMIDAFAVDSMTMSIGDGYSSVHMTDGSKFEIRRKDWSLIL